MDSLEFDKWVDTYERDVFRKKDVYPFSGYFQHVDNLKTALASKENCKVLDIGIGTGLMHSIISSEYNYQLVGIDFSEDMCKFVSKRFPIALIKKWDIQEARLPNEIEDKSFDFIVSAYCLHHFSNPVKKEIIDRYSKLLDVHGRFILIDISFDDNNAKSLQKKIAGNSWDSDEEDGYMKKHEILKLLELDYKVEYTKVSECSASCALSRR